MISWPAIIFAYLFYGTLLVLGATHAVSATVWWWLYGILLVAFTVRFLVTVWRMHNETNHPDTDPSDSFR